MSKSYGVKIAGSERLGLEVVSEHMTKVTDVCKQPRNAGKLVPLYFGKNLPSPISYLLIGAKVTSPANSEPEISAVTFRTNIQLAQSKEIEDLMPQLVEQPGDQDPAYNLGFSLVRTECAVDLQSTTTFDSGQQIPKKPWLDFVGTSFSLALSISNNYERLVPQGEQGEQTPANPALGKIVVGNLPIVAVNRPQN